MVNAGVGSLQPAAAASELAASDVDPASAEQAVAHICIEQVFKLPSAVLHAGVSPEAQLSMQVVSVQSHCDAKQL